MDAVLMEGGRGGAAEGAAPVVRLAGPADVPGICALIGRGNRRRAEPGEIRRCVLRAPCVVGCSGGEVVGFIYGEPFAPDVLEWRNMVVAPELRRSGLGTRIVEKGEMEARRHGYRALVGSNSWLHAGGSPGRSAGARAFWHRMGWREVLRTGAGDTVVIVKDLDQRRDAGDRRTSGRPRAT
ncbi:MAG: GNAT family N-acetyltransferase [Thermoleophilia bacterium]|jgi:GNAT superfamily N-acetyltransferase|nr:GNAT family N-acetyltransferase [Thermoleophilia bacterium]